jgi:hypothetical protein
VSDKLTAEIKRTLDEHIDWVNRATELGLTEGPGGITRAIAALDDDQLRGMIFVLVTTRVGDVECTREAIRDRLAREQLEALDDGRPV